MSLKIDDIKADIKQNFKLAVCTTVMILFGFIRLYIVTEADEYITYSVLLGVLTIITVVAFCLIIIYNVKTKNYHIFLNADVEHALHGFTDHVHACDPCMEHHVMIIIGEKNLWVIEHDDNERVAITKVSRFCLFCRSELVVK